MKGVYMMSKVVVVDLGSGNTFIKLHKETNTN